MKRIILFLVTNLAVVLVLSIVLRMLGLDRFTALARGRTSAGIRYREEPIIEANFSRNRVRDRKPVDVALDFARVSAGRSTSCRGIVRAMNGDHDAACVLVDVRAADDVRIAQTNFGARREPEIALRWILAEIVAFDP